MDHARDVLHVDAARGDVGGDQRVHVAPLERRERAVALGLLHLAGEHRDDEAGVRERGRDVGHVRAGAREDERLSAGVLEEEVDDRGETLARMDEMDEVLDVEVRRTERRAFDRDPVLLDLVGERLDLTGERRRDEVRPVLLRREAEDRLEVLAEPEVEHAVGLVEHDRGRGGRVDRSALQVIEQAPRRPDDDRGLRTESAELVAIAAAAGDRRDARSERPIEPGELLFDLLRELTRRRDHQRARPRSLIASFRVAGRLFAFGLRLGFVALRTDVVTDRETNRDGLARARLRADPEILALELGREHRLLDGRQPFEALGLERSRELGTDGLFQGFFEGLRVEGRRGLR